MFVTKAKYDKLEKELAKYQLIALMWKKKAEQLDAEIKSAIPVIEKMNEKMKAQRMSDDELKDLLRLCHPDKHGNSEISQRMTKRLNIMRDK